MLRRHSADAVGRTRPPARGIALVPENRKSEGLALLRSVRRQSARGGPAQAVPLGLFEPSRAFSAADRYHSAPTDCDPGPARSRSACLSGGNQQKVVIGKWLAAGSQALHLRRADARHRRRSQGRDLRPDRPLVAEGAAVLMIQSELAEIVTSATAPMSCGTRRSSENFHAHELTEENILRLAMHHA